MNYNSAGFTYVYYLILRGIFLSKYSQRSPRLHCHATYDERQDPQLLYDDVTWSSGLRDNSGLGKKFNLSTSYVEYTSHLASIAVAKNLFRANAYKDLLRFSFSM